MSYELVKDEIEYSADDITKIVFKEIICDKNINNKIYYNLLYLSPIETKSCFCMTLNG